MHREVTSMNQFDTRAQPMLPFSHYAFIFSTDEAIKLPVFPGSAWRGALGNALKKTVCIVRNTPCQACLLKSSCAYSYIFETPPPDTAEKMRKYNATPHPFVLQLPQTNNPETNHYQLDLVIFGHALRYFPYIVHALQKAGKDGIGGSRQVFSLLRIDQISIDGKMTTVYQDGKLNTQNQHTYLTIPTMPQGIIININTPLRIKQNGKNLGVDQFKFAAFFGNLLRRISMLTYFHSDTPLETDFAGLTRQARKIEFYNKQLRWYDWKRYSSRQQTEMNMGGVIGSLQLDMHGLDDFWPYLWLGQWTHAGKATSMGMGGYTIKTTSLPTQ
jgi:CRISPR-associated endoribonuclease Cas6